MRAANFPLIVAFLITVLAVVINYCWLALVIGAAEKRVPSAKRDVPTVAWRRLFLATIWLVIPLIVIAYIWPTPHLNTLLWLIFLLPGISGSIQSAIALTHV